jgi:hypothetical protein
VQKYHPPFATPDPGTVEQPSAHSGDEEVDGGLKSHVTLRLRAVGGSTGVGSGGTH